MKQRAMKKGLSALCLALALCMTFQSATLAADLSADSSTSGSTASVEADAAEGDTSSGEEEAAAEEEEKAEPAEEEEAEADAPAEEEESAPAEEEEADPAEEEPADPAEDEEDAGEADVILSAQATDNGWTSVNSNSTSTSWTFYYKESSSSTAAKAADEVLYIPEEYVDTTTSTTFQAGYYYFDADGNLVADGSTSSVGAVSVLTVEDDGSYVCDSSADDSGKVVKVVATQTTSGSSVTVSSTKSYYTGYYDSLYYYNGEKFTGYVRTSSSSAVYVMTDGVLGSKLTGQMSSSTAYVRTDSGAKSTGDGLWYYNGAIFTGYVRRSSSDYVWKVTNGKGGTKLTGQMSSSTAYVRMDTGDKSTGDGLWYYDGSKFTGYVRRSSSDYVWKVTNGKGGTKLTGTMSSSTAYVRMDTGSKGTGDGKYYKDGKVYTGVADSYYYKKGVKQTSLRGWQTFDSNGNTSSKSSANTYYFTSTGKVYTNCWKNLKRNGTTYRFYFNSDGTLCKNLYKKSSAWKKKATKLVISRSTHTATLYATYNGSYTIPTKSFVISTSVKSSNFKVGTYKLSQRKSWFTISSTSWWYKWATYISGSGSWTHSEQYYTKGNSKSLRISSYNNLGTNQSKTCIRMQVVNAKLIYDMRGYGSIKTVVLNKSSNKGPFGQMTITDNVDKSGKLSGTKGYDPTDPLYT